MHYVIRKHKYDVTTFSQCTTCRVQTVIVNTIHGENPLRILLSEDSSGSQGSYCAREAYEDWRSILLYHTFIWFDCIWGSIFGRLSN